MDAWGDVVTPLDHANAEAVAAAIRESGAESVAVCFLHAYKDPRHEVAMGEILRRLLNDAYVSLSHEIVREYREYERISTTVMNAYIGPKTSEYVGRMQERLASDGFDGRIMIMQSNGGLMAPERAKVLPVAMMESGPVGGVIASAEVGRRLGHPDVIAFDMGGTTAKTSLVNEGEAPVAQGYFIGGYASGHPVMFPVVDITEVGAGGGSIAWIDEVGALKLGPHSAGSDPGPISYRRGGTEPTVTDANVVLGRIGAASFLGGEMALDEEGARKGIEEKLCGPLGMNATEVAWGIIKIAVAKMSLAVRGVSVERGFDPRDFAMTAIGGAGPLHALQIARELYIPTVIVPNLPAHFSALGMLMADVRYDYVRTYYRPLAQADFDELGSIYAELGAVGEAALDEAGVDAGARSFPLFMDLRYVGQEFHIPVPVDDGEIKKRDVDAIRNRFNDYHDRHFGHSAEDEPIELVNLRLAARGARPKILFPELAGDPADAQTGTRSVYIDSPDKPVDCPVYRRERIAPGVAIKGPAVIEEYASTTVLFGGDEAIVAPTGEIIICVGKE
jgi:N-methylhydantoinase A